MSLFTIHPLWAGVQTSLQNSLKLRKIDTRGVKFKPEIQKLQNTFSEEFINLDALIEVITQSVHLPGQPIFGKILGSGIKYLV